MKGKKRKEKRVREHEKQSVRKMENDRYVYPQSG